LPRVGIVTGGASGIGLGIVRHLADAGMAVVAVDRDATACDRAREGLADLAERVAVAEGDVGTPEGAALGAQLAVERFGRIDLLCNNAAIHVFATIEEHDLESWRESFRVNVDGAMLCSRAVLPQMKAQRGGAIVNIGSVSGVLPYATGGAYACTKAALAMLTRVLAVEAGPFGIRVNCISPGSIRHRAPADAAPGFIPIGRHGTVADVAHLVAFLASDGATYVNGAEIVLDGGATAGRERRSPVSEGRRGAPR
jgi:NAD(P)-dependent dehydrogenase (short-subunit alcohol dehydrogenase family)